MADKKHDFGAQYCQIEMIMLYRRHPLAVNFTDRELLDYLRVWGMACGFRRVKLPDPFTATPSGYRLIAEYINSDRRVVKSMIAKAVRKCNRKSLLKVDRKGVITICGVEIKHSRLGFKDVTKVLPQRDPFGQFTGANKAKEEQNKKKKKEWVTPDYSCPDDLKPIEKAINAIRATNYDRVRMDPSYENIFRTSAEIFMRQGEKNGLARCVTEIIKLSGWLEGQFDIGRLQRDARHNPRQRITNWFRNAIKPPPPRDNEPRYQPSDEGRRKGDAVLLGDILKKSTELEK